MIDHSVAILWAKTGVSPRGEPTEHPLLCHLIYVAEVTRTMWNVALPAAARRRFGEQLGLREEAAGHWISFLASMHDLGKASPAFQLRQELTRERLTAAGWMLPRRVAPVPHGTITAVALKDFLPRRFARPRGTPRAIP
jgi:CRISPR-associated endonuclease/helicase Cas3